MMTYHPVGADILVELRPTPQREGAIYLPDRAQMRSQVGWVKAIGPRVEPSLGIKHGDMVYLDPFLPDRKLESADGKDCLLVKTGIKGGHVLAVIGREW